MDWQPHRTASCRGTGQRDLDTIFLGGHPGDAGQGESQFVWPIPAVQQLSPMTIIDP